jgi:hypothetical protein
MTVIQPHGVKLVVSLIQLKLGYAYVSLENFMEMTVLSNQAHMI